MTPQAADAPASTPFTASRPAVVTQPGEGVTVSAFGNEILFQLSTEQTGGALVVGLANVPPGGRVPPHVQTREDELFLILEGDYRFFVADEWKEVRAGGLVYVPRGVPHTFQVVGERPGRHWVINAPGGFDRFFARCAEVFAVPGPPDVSRLATINADFGISLLPPK